MHDMPKNKKGFYTTYLNIFAAEKRPSEISIGSQVSHSSRGKEAEFEFFAISFCT
jgi:hypothetical protein